MDECEFVARNTGGSIDNSATELARIRRAYDSRRDHGCYSFFAPAQILAIHERERILLRMLAARGYASFENKRVLEIGCGTGTWLSEFLRWGVRPENLWGIDLLPNRIEIARQVCPSTVTLQSGNSAALDFADGFFDLVLQSTVFSSVFSPNLKKEMAREMLRVLDRDGLIIWYDLRVNNPNNPDVWSVKSDEIRALFPECRFDLRRVTLAPPLGRPVAKVSAIAYHALSEIKPLCSHYLGLIEKI